MAFSTLDALRTKAGGLNDELGLTSDSDNSFGTTAQRNGFTSKAIAGLWPDMGRLLRETLVTVQDQVDYTLTSLYDVERIHVIDPDTGTLISDRVKSWELMVDEAADPAVYRLRLPPMTAGLTLRCIGYAPYIVPSSGGASCDLPPRLEWIVFAGARYFAYRFMASRFVNFERFQNENRSNAVTAADLIEFMRDAKREYDRGRSENRRSLTGATRAIMAAK